MWFFKKDNTDAKSVSHEKNDDLNKLQDQIKRHFLFNAFESVRAQAIEEGARATADMIAELLTLYRYSAEKESAESNVYEELRNVENYINIFKHKSISDLEMIIEADDDTLDCRMPGMVLQPIVENALVHGVADLIGPKVIKITCRRVDDILEIRIHNNGAGMDSETLSELKQALKECNDQDNNQKLWETTGIALINVQRRLKCSFGNGYGLNVYSVRGTGTEVVISIPA